MSYQDLRKNPSVLDQEILGAIAAAPHGLTLLTLQVLCCQPTTVSPDKVKKTVARHITAGLVRREDGVHTPTPQLIARRDRWVTDKDAPADTRRRDDDGYLIIPPDVTRHVLHDFLTTTLSYQAIGRRWGLGKYLAERVIRGAMAADDFVWRAEEREVEREEVRAALSTHTVCLCGGHKLKQQLVCVECVKDPERHKRAAATAMKRRYRKAGRVAA